jgi:general bacterial porin, GBP family
MMKRKIFLVATIGAFASVSHAQSSVTLYGIVDTGITYTNNNGGHASWQMTSGNESASRLGFKGSEDLGGGLKAIFVLENGYNIDNGALGQGGRMFGRQAWVGISHDNYGTLTLGRQYNAMVDIMDPLQISTTLTAYSAHPMDNDAILATYRTNNMVKYTTRNYSGFQAEAMYAFSNSTSFDINRSYSFGASYSVGSFSLGAAYERLSSPAFNKDTSGAVASDNFYSYTTTPFLATAQTVQQWAVGGNYNLGSLTVGLLYTSSSFENPLTGSLFSGATGSGGGVGSVRFQNIDGSVRYFFTPFLVGAAGETYTHATEGAGSGNYWQTNTGIQYFLSKRTDLYVNAIYQKTSRNLNAWVILASAPSTTTSQFLGVIGIRHKF